MSRPEIIKSEIVYRGFFDVKKDLLKKPTGETLAYHSVVLPAFGVVVLAKSPEGLWILSKEYRHPTGEYVLGLPGGRLEEGEDPHNAAQRELFEEAGYWADELILIGSSYTMPAVCNQKIIYYFAPKTERKEERQLDPFEFIETVLMSSEELKNWVQNEISLDGLLCTALWHWQQIH